jgi:hypothetical protein
MSLLFTIAHTKEPPAVPDNLSQPCRDMLLACMEVRHEERESEKMDDE